MVCTTTSTTLGSTTTAPSSPTSRAFPTQSSSLRERYSAEARAKAQVHVLSAFEVLHTVASLRAATPSKGQQSHQAAVALSLRDPRASAVSSARPRTFGTQTNFVHSTPEPVQANPSIQLSQSVQIVDDDDVEETSTSVQGSKDAAHGRHGSPKSADIQPSHPRQVSLPARAYCNTWWHCRERRAAILRGLAESSGGGRDGVECGASREVGQALDAVRAVRCEGIGVLQAAHPRRQEVSAPPVNGSGLPELAPGCAFQVVFSRMNGVAGDGRAGHAAELGILPLAGHGRGSAGANGGVGEGDSDAEGGAASGEAVTEGSASVSGMNTVLHSA
eukprot:1748639-Pleurochrysis_carterae.AAC.1